MEIGASVVLLHWVGISRQRLQVLDRVKPSLRNAFDEPVSARKRVFGQRARREAHAVHYIVADRLRQVDWIVPEKVAEQAI